VQKPLPLLIPNANATATAKHRELEYKPIGQKYMAKVKLEKIKILNCLDVMGFLIALD
jgi:hypothetical protein